MKPLNGGAISRLVPSESRVNQRVVGSGGPHMKEQRLRRGMLLTVLTWRNASQAVR